MYIVVCTCSSAPTEAKNSPDGENVTSIAAACKNGHKKNLYLKYN